MRLGHEGFIEFIIRDCNVDSRAGWARAVEEARERRRRRQTETLVRDALDEVVRVLTESGYTVPPSEGGGRPGKPDRLRRW